MLSTGMLHMRILSIRRRVISCGRAFLACRKVGRSRHRRQDLGKSLLLGEGVVS